MPTATNLLLVDGRLPSSTGISYLVQFSGGGSPSALSLRGFRAQIDVLERKPNGGSRVFRGFVPLIGSFTSGTVEASHLAPGTAHPLAGIYPGTADPMQLSFTLVNREATYMAAVNAAASTEVMVGPGNAKGNSGPDYLRITRYFCPFNRQGGGGTPMHQTCGAMIVYVTKRVDLDGYLVECLFANAHLPTPITSYMGDVPENPGHIVYDSLTFSTGSTPTQYTVRHADSYTGFGGTENRNLAKPMGSGQRHLSAPGTAPGWMFAIYNTSTPADRVDGMLEGKDNAIAYSGHGFHPGSQFGFGPNELRHDDPDNWLPNDSRNQMRVRVQTLVSALKGYIQGGTFDNDASESASSLRMGVYQAFGPRNPNTSGGTGIMGHYLDRPIPEFSAFLRLGSMMATRRSNHSFYQWCGTRPLLPADAVVDYADPTPGEMQIAKVSLLHAADVGALTSRSIPSTQFACPSPSDGTILGFRGNGTPTIPTQNEQGTHGPQTRTWNTLGAGESLPFAAFGGSADNAGEDPASFIGYSHNLGHSPRFFIAREAYLFGLSMLGYDLAVNYAAFAACHNLSFDVDEKQQDWRYSRADRNLHAHGARDLLGLTAGSGRVNARRRNYLGDLGPLTGTSGSSNFGQQALGYHTGRNFAWSMVWQFSGASIGNDSYRSATIGYSVPTNNVASLFGQFVLRVQTPVGATSQAQVNIGTNLCFVDSSDNGGQTNLAARTGGLPAGGTDNEYWTASLAFQDVYFTMAVDAGARHLAASTASLLQPTRERIFWQLIQNQANVEPGTGRIGIPYCPPVSRGVHGLGANPFAVANPVATEANLRNDVTRWIYANVLNSLSSGAFIPSGWGHELANSSLGALMALRGMGTAKRAEFAALLKRQWSLPPTATTAQLLAAMRQGTFEGRRSPFLSEVTRYL